MPLPPPPSHATSNNLEEMALLASLFFNSDQLQICFVRVGPGFSTISYRLSRNHYEIEKGLDAHVKKKHDSAHI